MTARQRLDSLTGLRFFAAGAVLLYHLVEYFHQRGAAVPTTGFGFTGVAFFFVLSGLVLAWAYRPQTSAPRFYALRFSRVWPLHGLTWVIAALLFGIGSPRVYTGGLLLLQAWVPAARVHFGGNAVAWSLSCEAFFYALFPFVVPRLMRTAHLRRFVVSVVTAQVIVGAAVYLMAPANIASWFLYICPGYRVCEFLIGMAVGVALRTGRRAPVSLPAAAGLLAAAIVVLTLVLPITPGHYDTRNYWVYDMAVLPGVVLLLWAAAARDLSGGTWLGATPIRLLGEWSFALYLTHQLIIRLAVQHGIDGVKAAALCAALAIPVAAIAHLTFERPVEGRLRNLLRKRAPRQGGIPPRRPWRGQQSRDTDQAEVARASSAE